MTAKRYTLTARAQINGAIREPGFVFTLEDGEKGPSRTVVASDHGANHDGAPGELREEPLYVALPDEEPAEDETAESVADED